LNLALKFEAKESILKLRVGDFHESSIIPREG
jgi:hypothetical protein